MLMRALNMFDVPMGELLIYTGTTPPALTWTAEGVAVTDNTTPVFGLVEAGPKTINSVFSFSSAMAKVAGPEAEMEFMRWIDQLMYESWITAALVGDGTANEPTGILRSATIPKSDYGAALTEANIRAAQTLLRTQKGVGMDPLWILSEAWATAAIDGGWASATSPHGGVVLPDDAGNGIPYIIVQALATVGAVVDPGIMCYRDQFWLPTWGMTVTRFPDPNTADTKYRMQLACEAIQTQEHLIRDQPHLI